MLPRIAPEFTIQKNYRIFCEALAEIFQGEICISYAARLSMAVDNSIYQVLPEAILFPRTIQDIVTILTLAHQDKFRDIQFCPRGGGTSTNGQSLSSGIMIDCSKYMRNILELNLNEGWVRVQPGVIVDQLNQYLKPYGVSFAPNISPSNRATIGGMVNTDACGIGSSILGRTSDHVLNLTCILPNGKVIESSELDEKAPLYKTLDNLIKPHLPLIDKKFKNIPRTLNGYNLKKAYSNRLNLNYLFCGSEGTLAVVGECKLKVTPLPKYKKLLVVHYRSFEDALRSFDLLKLVNAFAIEAIDECLMDLAREDSIYFSIKKFIDGENYYTRSINIVEFISNDEKELQARIEAFCKLINKNKPLPNAALGFYIAKNNIEEKLLWELRKKSVGLISKKKDKTRRPIPFVEDTAVPPEMLADYIKEFKSLLDEYNLVYGMYGHVDAGCVHVRPALNMQIVEDKKMLQELSNKVVLLIEKYGGVLWGEHGQGFRSQYTERFFGAELYYIVRQIKTLFDPYNQLNPGKIAVSLETHQELVKINGPMRGDFDKQIRVEWQNNFSDALACNGNGACFNYETADIMCPSYKVTRDRIQSPKGRATVLREWLRHMSNKKIILNVYKGGNFLNKLFASLGRKPDFSHEVFSAMSGCLSCKACANQCPLNVDVPEFKSKFLAYYYQRYFRPLRDYCISALENLAPIQAKYSFLNNIILGNYFSKKLLTKVLKITDIPNISTISLKKEFKKRQLHAFDLQAMTNLNIKEKSRSVILIQDAFTSFYNPHVILATYDCLKKLGFTVYVAPFFPSGKPLHVNGFLRKFQNRVNKNNRLLKKIAETDIPFVGIDPSITLIYRDEYRKFSLQQEYKVFLLQEWLIDKIPLLIHKKNNMKDYYLLSHCTEKSLCIESEAQWGSIFSQFHLNLNLVSVGCCGMAGSYGHEVEHAENSHRLFKMDWEHVVKENPMEALATGYSCHSQVKRFMNITLQHPIEILLKELL